MTHIHRKGHQDPIGKVKPGNLKDAAQVKAGLKKLKELNEAAGGNHPALDPEKGNHASNRDAIKAFQTKHNLKVDGILGKQTLAAIEKAKSEAAPAPAPAPKPGKDTKAIENKPGTGPIGDSVDLSKVAMPGLAVQKALGLSRPTSSAGARKAAETLADATEGARPIQSPLA